ncbi:MAG: toll/interleukin-1 receptor domain-containing protein [Novosphingobium sp.]|nr:toll/interleukin-1 receptor domain-containing protein [Novosphingobium sp.]MBP6556520.1 toll/interleukin-1 receptor domain-containing protein [Novosphingobium sp.]
MTAFRYKAFVSYSWADATWGNWLQKAIETYRAPSALVGKEGALGPVPARLHPLFKDREEEAAGASIGAAVETALAASEFLIVVCSPNSAKSKWVDCEVAWFKTHRDPAKVLALIVDGEPGGGRARMLSPCADPPHRARPDDDRSGRRRAARRRCGGCPARRLHFTDPDEKGQASSFEILCHAERCAHLAAL